MRVPALVLLLAAASLVPGVTAQQELLVDSIDGGPATVDLKDDASKVLRFRLDEARHGQAYASVTVRMMKTGETPIDLALQKSGGVWSATLPVSTRDLVTGSWTTSFIVLSGTTPRAVSQHAVQVTASDSSAPTVQVLPAQRPLVLAAGAVIDVQVQDDLLRRVTYHYPGLPVPLELQAQFALPASSLPEGPSTLTIVAQDRAGQSMTVQVPVDRDTQLPVLNATLPGVVYAGVPAEVLVHITERSAHTIAFAVGNDTQVFPVAANQATDGKVRRFTFMVPEAGNATLSLAVEDQAGNRVFEAQTLQAVPPVTDLRVVSLVRTSPASAVVQEGVTVRATLEQVGGVAALPVVVNFTTVGREASFNVTVPAQGPLDVTWTTELRGGRHTIRVQALGPATANETNPGNENGSVDVEVFLGRITDSSKVYAIRADPRGLPAVAVQVGTSLTYPLKLVDLERGVGYSFTVPDNRTLVWDPLSPVSTAPPVPRPPAEEEAPFPGLAMALLVLVLAALAQRRRA
jgi:MYXO-CTERM domain-containing protein